MGYQSTTINAIVSSLNDQYFLPAIQREFVWKPEQIVTLMDSIMRGYPINSLLFWKLEREKYAEWDVYKFIQDFDPQHPHNELQDNKNWIQTLILVLDGQQRLTSLLIALRGSYVVKKKHANKSKARSWLRQQLYLDLLKDGNAASDNDDSIETDVTYGFKFMSPEQVPSPNTEHYWFKVSEILSFHSEDDFGNFLEDRLDELEGLSRDQKKTFRANLNRLYNAIWKDDMIAYHTELQQDPDRVLDIFARANMGGTKLSKSDLLLSMVTAKWKGINAREEIHGFVEELNTKLTRRNDFDKDFILKTCLVLTDLPVQYRVLNFSNSNLSKFRQHWEDIKRAIRNTIDLVNTFGIDKENLTSANALIPLIYFLYKKGKDFRGTTPYERKNAMRMRRWLITVLLNQVFSGQSDSTLYNIRRVLYDNSALPDFPVEALNAEIKRMGRLSDLNPETFLEVEYNDDEDFLALSLLYDEKNWGTISYQKDHIFPQSYFEVANLKKLGLDDESVKRYRRLYNRIGNLELLKDTENGEKNAKPFERWITTRDASFRKEHLIPTDDNLLKMECFEQFLEAREKLIEQRLQTLFAETETL